ncbi:MAG: peptidoglycan-binding protein LysM [Saprospiraceae bacterium]|nr:peptidoglycan-binding protein LysM [Saprospiraceae bacterium]
MGLFTFIKDAGAKIFGGKTSAEKEAATEASKAQQIAELIHGLNLEISELSVSVEDDKAVLGGLATNQAAREKAILAAGNVEGIATVEDNINVEAPEPEAQFYTVQSGDSLSKIAKEFYGDPMKYPSIFEANKPMLTHPDKIYPGQVLRIPNA